MSELDSTRPTLVYGRSDVFDDATAQASISGVQNAVLHQSMNAFVFVCLFGTGLQLKDTVVIAAPDQWIRLRSLRLLKLQIKNSLTVRFSSIPRQLYRKA